MTIATTIDVIDAHGATKEVYTASGDQATAANQTTQTTLLSDIVDSVALAPEIVLLTAASVTGSSNAVDKGNYLWAVWGTFDGATATLQYTPNAGTTWIDVGASTQADLRGVPLLTGSARVAISGAGGSTSLSSKIGGVS